jgi:hypothetical protein
MCLEKSVDIFFPTLAYHAMGLTSLIICFSFMGLSEMNFLCEQFKTRSK